MRRLVASWHCSRRRNEYRTRASACDEPAQAMGKPMAVLMGSATPSSTPDGWVALHHTTLPAYSDARHICDENWWTPSELAPVSSTVVFGGTLVDTSSRSAVITTPAGPVSALQCSAMSAWMTRAATSSSQPKADERDWRGWRLYEMSGACGCMAGAPSVAAEIAEPSTLNKNRT
eukprot:scaffold26606_cov124-Isochrysis_galbana.AAC.6